MGYLLNTTDDNVVETPDESLTVALYIPGMFPSFLGDLIAVVNIEVRDPARDASDVPHRSFLDSNAENKNDCQLLVRNTSTYITSVDWGYPLTGKVKIVVTLLFSTSFGRIVDITVSLALF